MERLCCAAHGGCLSLYLNYQTWKYGFELKMSFHVAFTRCFSFRFHPKAKKAAKALGRWLLGLQRVHVQEQRGGVQVPHV